MRVRLDRPRHDLRGKVPNQRLHKGVGGDGIFGIALALGALLGIDGRRGGACRSDIARHTNGRAEVFRQCGFQTLDDVRISQRRQRYTQSYRGTFHSRQLALVSQLLSQTADRQARCQRRPIAVERGKTAGAQIRRRSNGYRLGGNRLDRRGCGCGGLDRCWTCCRFRRTGTHARSGIPAGKGGVHLLK